MTGLIALWSHLLAAALFGGLTIFQLRRWNGDPLGRPLITAFAVMAVWAIFKALLGPVHLLSGLAESARNLAFLAFLYGIMAAASEGRRQHGVKAVYAAVAGVVGLQIVIAGLLPEFRHVPLAFAALEAAGNAVGLTIAAGSLVLVHNLYGQAAPGSRGGIRLPMIALAAMWVYDLHLYTAAWLGAASADELFAMRGALAALLAPLFGFAIRRHASWTMRLSRAAAFQSLSLIGILAYLIVMVSATRAMEIVDGEWVGIAQIAIIMAMTLAAAILLPSARARAWLGVVTAKHFFEHRYDYREEWLRFTRTVAGGGEDKAPLEQRVVKALADIAGSSGGLLLLAGEGRRLEPAASWNWEGPEPGGGAGDPGFADFLETTGFVVDFSALHDGVLQTRKGAAAVPEWLARLDAWAGVPLLHEGRLVGLVLLAHLPVRRPLDWEDYDLFRAAGIQAASYLAEARGQQALADAQRFDEFNRRFAFIMHDIKNLVSQLSLVARNAERHADNPAFREDMIATLQASVKKMNDLLARLSQGSRSEPGAQPRAVALQPLVAAVAAGKGRAHPVEPIGEAGLVASADPAGLEQALGHLVQNAIEASPAGAPVRIRFSARGGEATIEVIDRGAGMAPEFVRTRLFQPFASTKSNGFGVGAYEARCLIAAMGGRLEVESREGEGTCFTIFLPCGATQAAPEPERMRA